MAVTRPLKEGSTTTYQAKVAAGFPDILASEVDADLDTIYAAWNGGVGTANLVDGSVTDAKIVSVGWNKLTTGTVAAGGDLAGSTYPNPVIAAGKVTKAKLGPDVTGLFGQDFTGRVVGASTTAFVNLITIQAAALLVSRRYRLCFSGEFNIVSGATLTFNMNVGTKAVFTVSALAPANGNFLCEVFFLIDGAGNGWASGQFTYSSTRTNTSTASQGFAVCNSLQVASATTLGPVVDVQFSTSNAANVVKGYQATLEIL